MELDFDKEIDALLRNAENSTPAFRAANPKFAIQNPHLDADELSAFAENALPEKTRRSFLLHLADCDGCRKILSNLIVLNSEAGSGAGSALTAPAIAGENISWYRKLFLFPNLAYVMGSLVLVFSGFLGYLVLQNSGDSANSEVLQVDHSQTAPGAQDISGSSANTNMMSLSSNAVMNTNAAVSTPNLANSAANAARPESPALTANTATGDVASSRDKDFALDGADASAGVPAPTPAAAKEKQQLAEKDEFAQAKNVAKADAPVRQSQKQANEINTMRISPVPGGPSNAAQAQDRINRNQVRMSDGAELRSKKLAEPGAASNRKQVSGKTFELKQRVWYDSAYHGQATINIRRGMDEYRKLDSGLRIIAESLTGTVVAVWKEKAYRIQ